MHELRARKHPTATIGAALADAIVRLREASIESARIDARLLLAAALGCGVEHIIAWPERALSAAEMGAFNALVDRRAAREPIAQILGHREFWSLRFATTRDTLTPRPDSETVIESVLALFPDRTAPLRILDLGTGSGCLLLALLSEFRQAHGIGTDLSGPALRVAQENARALGLDARASFIRTSWDAGLSGSFDVIVSNPPYIPIADLAELTPEIRVYEPSLALDGGIDGLAAYREIAPLLPQRLAKDGIAVIEVGAGQAAAVEAILAESGLPSFGRRNDLAGIARCVLTRR